MAEPGKKPYLHVRSVDGLLFDLAVALTGNRRALLRLRTQIDRALADEGSVPFEEEIYHDVHGEPFEVAIKLAKRRSGMEEPVPRPEKTPEALPWAKLARGPKERKE